MDWLTMSRWSPEVVGVGVGILSWLAFLLMDRPIGCSTAFSKTTGLLEKIFRPAWVARNPYYKKIGVAIDGTWMLVVGLLIGAFVSARLSGAFHWHWVPNLWAQAFGPAPIPRLVAALLGGMLIGLGARWADGCTSGHGISGILQMSVTSIIAVSCFLIGGSATAMILYAFLAG